MASYKQRCKELEDTIYAIAALVNECERNPSFAIHLDDKVNQIVKHVVVQSNSLTSCKVTKTVKNLISGKEMEIPIGTPMCCDPSTETYWSM